MPGAEVLRPEVAAAARRYRLVAASRQRFGFGSRRGIGAGGAHEFFDFRAYAPGDDLRHLDWRGYARSDQLRVRLFEDEVAPVGDVLVDLSPRLFVTEAKGRAVRDLAQLFATWIRGEGGTARWLALGGGELHDVEHAEPVAGPPLAPPAVRLRPRGVRIVVSDFLVAADPGPALQRLADAAAQLFVVQLLDAWELEPPVGPALLLEAGDGPGEAEFAFTAQAVAGYRQRLQRLQALLRERVQGLGGVFATVTAGAPEAMCRQGLLPARVVEPQP